MADTAVLDPAVPDAAAGESHLVRVLPMPRSEPPSEDEWTARSWDPTAPALPLRLRPAGGAPRRRTAVRGAAGAFEVAPATLARAAGHGEVAVVVPDRAEGGPQPSEPAPALPEVRQATMRFVSMFLEVTAGFRPLTQLRPYCRPDRFERINDQLRGRASVRPSPMARGAAALNGLAVIVGRGPTSPPRGARATQRAPGDRLSLRRVQICQVSDSVAEVVAIFGRREASAAMALRLEKIQGRWLCSHLEIV